MSEKDTKALQTAVFNMDSLAQEGFGQVRALALLALSYMETPAARLHPDNIAHALTAIWHIADNVRDCVTGEADQVGHACGPRKPAGKPEEGGCDA